MVGKDKTKCYYCERELLEWDAAAKVQLPTTRTKDHVVPKCRGGKFKKNLVPCCIECNTKKGNKSLCEWEAVIMKIRQRQPGKWNFYIPLILVNIKSHPLYHPTQVLGVLDETIKNRIAELKTIIPLPERKLY